MNLQDQIRKWLAEGYSEDQVKTMLVDQLVVAKSTSDGVTSDISRIQSPKTEPVVDLFTEEKIHGEPPSSDSIKVGMPTGSRGGEATRMIREYAMLTPQRGLTQAAERLGDEFVRLPDNVSKSRRLHQVGEQVDQAFNLVVKALSEQAEIINRQSEIIVKSKADIADFGKRLTLLAEGYATMGAKVDGIVAKAQQAPAALDDGKAAIEGALAKARAAHESAVSLAALGHKAHADAQRAIVKSQFDAANAGVTVLLGKDSANTETLKLVKAVAEFARESGMMEHPVSSGAHADPVPADNQTETPSGDQPGDDKGGGVTKADVEAMMGHALGQVGRDMQMMQTTMGGLMTFLQNLPKNGRGAHLPPPNLGVSKAQTGDVLETIAGEITAMELENKITSDEAENGKRALFLIKNVKEGNAPPQLKENALSNLPFVLKPIFAKAA